MGKRKFNFKNGNFYHIYNRGVDKRDIFIDKDDLNYFLDRMKDFNSTENFGGVYHQNLPINLKLISKASKLVEIVAFAVISNHFHMILKQKEDNGITNFMHKVGTGFTKFFNKKYNRNGSLFQGKFKAVEIRDEGHLSYLSAYVNLNDKVHKINNNNLIRTSWSEYKAGIGDSLCVVKEVLKLFKGRESYKKYALEELKHILKERYTDKDKKDFLD